MKLNKKEKKITIWAKNARPNFATLTAIQMLDGCVERPDAQELVLRKNWSTACIVSTSKVK